MSELVNDFKASKILNHGENIRISQQVSETILDPVAHSIVLLGETTEHAQAILILKKTPFAETTASNISWDRLETLESNDIASALANWTIRH